MDNILMNTNLSKADRRIPKAELPRNSRASDSRAIRRSPHRRPVLTCLLPSSSNGSAGRCSRAERRGLARHRQGARLSPVTIQREDGSWDSNGEGGHAVAMTSLSLMAFMSKAHFPGFGQYGRVSWTAG